MAALGAGLGIGMGVGAMIGIYAANRGIDLATHQVAKGMEPTKRFATQEEAVTDCARNVTNRIEMLSQSIQAIATPHGLTKRETTAFWRAHEADLVCLIRDLQKCQDLAEKGVKECQEVIAMAKAREDEWGVTTYLKDHNLCVIL